MGSNKRYAEHYDRLMDRRIVDGLMRSGDPESLSPSELELEREPLTRAPHPRPVRAWVRYAGTAVQVDALATAWTDYAVAIKWTDSDGREHRAWVWASAVRTRT